MRVIRSNSGSLLSKRFFTAKAQTCLPAKAGAQKEFNRKGREERKGKESPVLSFRSLRSLRRNLSAVGKCKDYISQKREPAYRQAGHPSDYAQHFCFASKDSGILSLAKTQKRKKYKRHSEKHSPEKINVICLKPASPDDQSGRNPVLREDDMVGANAHFMALQTPGFGNRRF